MKWWNDLWLKESFADFACYHALMHIELSFETIDFRRSFNQRKKWGYTAD
jgi:aminopeptidase N